MCWVQHGGQGFQSSREVSSVLGGQGFQTSHAAMYSTCQALQLPFSKAC